MHIFIQRRQFSCIKIHCYKLVTFRRLEVTKAEKHTQKNVPLLSCLFFFFSFALLYTHTHTHTHTHTCRNGSMLQFAVITGRVSFFFCYLIKIILRSLIEGLARIYKFVSKYILTCFVQKAETEREQIIEIGGVVLANQVQCALE